MLCCVSLKYDPVFLWKRASPDEKTISKSTSFRAVWTHPIFVIIGFRFPTLYKNAADYSPGKEILTIILPILSMNNL